MVHAFGDHERKQAVRDLAARVRELEAQVASRPDYPRSETVVAQYAGDLPNGWGAVRIGDGWAISGPFCKTRQEARSTFFDLSRQRSETAETRLRTAAKAVWEDAKGTADPGVYAVRASLIVSSPKIPRPDWEEVYDEIRKQRQAEEEFARAERQAVLRERVLREETVVLLRAIAGKVGATVTGSVEAGSK
jgi:cell division septum initiation protein DivIVA